MDENEEKQTDIINKIHEGLNVLKQKFFIYDKNINNISTFEIIITNQFGTFDDLIKKYQTPGAICGYYAPAAGKLIIKQLKKNQQSENFASQIINLSKFFDQQQNLREQIESSMISIQQTRKNYIALNNKIFVTESEKDTYVRDWVATYEIGDYLLLQKESDLFFLRIVSNDFPEEAAKAVNEEKLRIEQEDKQFNGQGYFVQTFNETDKTFMSLSEWIQVYQIKKSNQKNKNYVFIIDLHGHFCSSLVGQQNGEKFVIFFGSMSNPFLENPATTVLQQMVFE